MPDTFVCPRYPGGLTLSTGACASMWREGQHAQPWDRRYRCRGCEIGAGHAGAAAVAPPAPPDRECLRCGAVAPRLLRQQLCVSCYNRERELLTGRYRRKQPPRGLTIRHLQVLVAGLGAPVAVSAASSLEALRVAARRAPGYGVLAVTPGPRPLWAAPCLITPGS